MTVIRNTALAGRQKHGHRSTPLPGLPTETKRTRAHYITTMSSLVLSDPPLCPDRIHFVKFFFFGIHKQFSGWLSSSSGTYCDSHASSGSIPPLEMRPNNFHRLHRT